MSEDHTIAELAAGFDAFSSGYAAGFTSNRLAVEARRRARELYAQWLGPPGGLIADIGCGPGMDARWLTERGFRVVAVDCSVAMVDLAREALAVAGPDVVTVCHGDAFAPGFLCRVAPAPLDGAILGFGTVNCVSDLAGAFREVRSAVRKGAAVVVSSLSSRCLWDLLWHGATGRGIAPRWRRSPRRVNVADVECWMWFWTAAELRRAARPHFAVTEVVAVGSIAPPPYADSRLSRHPWLFTALGSLDRQVRHHPWAILMADMVWVVLRAV